MVSILKCKKCRYELIRETPCHLLIISPHGEKRNIQSSEGIPCSRNDQDALWFLEETGTSWISDVIEKFEWTKGKLNCPNCEARIGSFDFVSRSKCACGTSLLPSVHLVKSKVDSSIQGTDVLAPLKP